MKHSLPLGECHHLGIWFAASGWDEIRVGNWLLDQGYSTSGLTARRIQRAYFEQMETA